MTFTYSDFPTESTAYFGNPGIMIPIPFTNQVEVSESKNDNWSYQTTVTGRVHAQRRRFSRRTWEITPDTLPAQCYQPLRAMASGGFGDGPFHFILPHFGGINLITPDDSTFQSAACQDLFDSYGFNNTGGQMLDWQFQPGSVYDPAAETEYQVTDNFYVTAGRTVTTSAWLKGASSTLAIVFYDSGGNFVDRATSPGDGSDTEWARTSVTTTVPNGAVTAYVSESKSTNTAGVQVTYTDSLIDYMSGIGCTKAVLNLSELDYAQYSADGYWLMPKITVTEVG